MIAVVEHAGRKPCVVRQVARKGLKVKILTYCGQTADAAQGVAQVPEHTPLCEKCVAKLGDR